jgi:hypothetical protein
MICVMSNFGQLTLKPVFITTQVPLAPFLSRLLISDFTLLYLIDNYMTMCFMSNFHQLTLKPVYIINPKVNKVYFSR